MKYFVLVLLIGVVIYEVYDLVKKIRSRKNDNTKVAEVSDDEKSENDIK